MGRLFFAVFLTLALLVGGVWYLYSSPSDVPAILSYSYSNASTNDIVVFAPQPRDHLSTIFSITGNARGPWYFEASFPIVILDADGSTILQTHATADGEWMTTEFVPFSVDISLPGGYRGAATIVLHKDNPSGLSEYDASVSFPIVIE